MSKVTSKYQVSIPKSLADKVGIKVGDDLSWEDAGGDLRARVGAARKARFSIAERLRLFDAATARQSARTSRFPATKGRGWTRDQLYTR